MSGLDCALLPWLDIYSELTIADVNDIPPRQQLHRLAGSDPGGCPVPRGVIHVVARPALAGDDERAGLPRDGLLPGLDSHGRAHARHVDLIAPRQQLHRLAGSDPGGCPVPRGVIHVVARPALAGDDERALVLTVSCRSRPPCYHFALWSPEHQ